MKKNISRVRVAVAALVGGVMLLGATSTSSAAGTTSMAAVLTADGNQFDNNSKDFDVLTEAVLAVLANNPNSAVKVLTEGTVALTVFAPTDEAFRALVKDLTGKNVRSEKKIFAAVAGLGLPTVEAVLLYHVVAGSTITSKQALKADGATLSMASGGKVSVDVTNKKITLTDANDSLKDPMVIAVDINKGNAQIAHAIDRVLIPLSKL
ncbi:MAG: fasciclin domain-containing protein [Ilumatobacteraceae bacterium]